MYKQQFRALGTDVQLAVLPHSNSDAVVTMRHLEFAKLEILRLEQLMSRFISTSDVSMVNDNPGQWVPVHPETMAVLRLAQSAFRQTDGLFNPCLGGNIESYGYDVSFDMILDHEREDIVNTPPVVRKILTCPYMVSDDGNTVCLETGYKIDLGGIAKGWIIEYAAQKLRDLGFHDFVCDGGGDMVCAGKNGLSAWHIGITDPFDATRTVCVLDVDALCVATSGTYRRRWMQGSEQIHHILDPRSGLPAVTDLISCTVLHPSLVAAEILAKVFLILGKSKGIQWISEQDQQGWIAIADTGEVMNSWSL